MDEKPSITAGPMGWGNWEDQAHAFAEAGVAFDLHNFDYAEHRKFYNMLKKRHPLESRFSPPGEREAHWVAHFRPKRQHVLA